MTKPETEVRQATRADLDEFYGGVSIRPSFNAIVGLLDGVPVAVAGFAYTQGVVIAFCDLKPEARRYRMIIHKTALAVMEKARRLGHRRIYARADPNEPGAPRWLKRLGFEQSPDDETIWIWRLR